MAGGQKLVFEGLAELRAALRNLPATLTGEAAHIVEGAANDAAAAIKAGYGVQSGDLRDHLTVTHLNIGQFGVAIQVKNTARHAWLYDNGSEARHYIEKSGAEHQTGKMWGRRPPTHLFVRTAIRERRRMNEQLKDMVERNGLTVSGDV